MKKFFTLSGRIFDIKYMNKFFKKLYFVYQRKALHYQERKQGQLKFLYQGEADSIGYNHLCLTTAQVNARRDITIVFESAYVPNVKLLMTDDHRFLELVAEEGEVQELFWRTALETFRVDLTLKVCPAENFLFFLILKALCPAISADCLLIEAARAHAVNEHWAWRMADKFACTFKSAR